MPRKCDETPKVVPASEAEAKIRLQIAGRILALYQEAIAISDEVREHIEEMPAGRVVSVTINDIGKNGRKEVRLALNYSTLIEIGVNMTAVLEGVNADDSGKE